MGLPINISVETIAFYGRDDVTSPCEVRDGHEILLTININHSTAYCVSSCFCIKVIKYPSHM